MVLRKRQLGIGSRKKQFSGALDTPEIEPQGEVLVEPVGPQQRVLDSRFLTDVSILFNGSSGLSTPRVVRNSRIPIDEQPYSKRGTILAAGHRWQRTISIYTAKTQ